MKQLRYLLMAVLLVAVVVPAFSVDTTPTFNATKTTNSPTGSGYVYGYRGGGDYANGANGQNDRLTLPADGDWKSADNTLQVFKSTIKFQQTSPTGNQEPDGYRIMDKTANDGGNTEMALHMYFFAKPNPGYQFDGWFSNADGTGALTGSREHYPMPSVTSGCNAVSKNQKGGPYTPSTWDNGEGLTASSGYYAAGGFYYLRNVYLFKSFSGTTVYAKFSITPRTFTLAATGQAAVTYTATGYSGSISTSNVTTSALSSNISLNLTNPDPEQYIFEGWYWSDGKDGAQTLISESASATFSWTGNSDIVAKMNTVWIWPKVTKVVNSVADVTYNDVTTPYESWDAALTAAKAVSGATITLNQSVSDLSAVQTINKSMTIDLNGNTLTGSANNFFTITGSGVDVTITDNSPQGAGRIELINSTDATTYTVTVRSGAKLTVAGGTIYNKNENASGTARGVEAQSGTTLFVTGGHIEAQSLQNAYALINRGAATISGGDMYAHTTSKATAVAFYNVGTSATVNNGTFRATAATTTAYGIHQNVGNTITISDATVDVSAVTSTAYALARSAGVIVVTGGKYNASAPSAVAASNVTNNTQITLRGGVYTIHNNLVACAASGYVRTDLVYTDPDYADGYRYAIVNSDTEPYVCKVLASLDVFYYKSLEEAFAYVAANSSKELTIVVTSPSCTLSAGTYTVPSSTTLLVPYDVGGTVSMEKAPYYYNSNATRTRECYSKLTLASGVTLKVYGKLNVNALLHNRAGGQIVANVLDNYGRLHMNAGSHIDLENGSLCSVWGFITGDGTITAKSGSLVREAFQFDFRGGTHISNTYTKAFPMCQYYVQNIEAPITFNYGATENLFTCCYASSADREGVASFIGSDGMFRLESGSTLTRRYVGSEDRIYYDLYGNSSIQDISVDVEIAEMASKNYILPINSNMTLQVHSGTTTIYYDLSLLPDSKVIIDEGATVAVKQNFYIYDKSDWRADETGYTYKDDKDNTQKSYFAVGADLNVVPFSPTKTKTRTSAELTDAHVVVNGTLKTLSTAGKLYTTTHGADITSEGSGKVILGVAAGSTSSFKQGVSTASKVQDIPVTAAQLHNGNDTYTATAGASANTTYGYCEGTWTPGGCINYYTITWKSENGNTTLETDANVAEGSATSFDGTAPTKTATAEYTYAFDGWATEAHGAKVYEINGTPVASGNTSYFAHFSQTPVPYTLSWVTDGNALIGDYTSGSTNFGAAITAPNTPTKTGYTFAGWHNGTSVVTPATTMPAAAVTYTATWTPNTNTAYTVKHYQQNIDGTYPSTPTETQNLTGTTGAEVTPAVKSYMGFTAPSAQTVTILADGSRVVTYNYTRNSYTITWKDGTKTITTTQVKHGARPAYNYQKQQTPQYTFTLTHWADESHNQYALDNLPLATEAAIYTAIYESVERSYTIRFLNDDGTTVLYSTEVTYGVKPTYEGSTPQSTLNDGWLRHFTGWSPDIVEVNGAADYTAQYEQVTLLDVPDEQSVPVSATVTTTTVRVTGKLAIESSATLTTDDLILEGTPNSSGEIVGEGTVAAAQHAYYDLTKDGGFKAKTWYAVAVPWQVDVPAYQKAHNGVYAKEAGGAFVQQELGRSYDLIYYDGGLRAAEGHSDACWKYVEDDAAAEHIMYPGRAYMIYFLKDIETIRFERKENASLKTTTLAVKEHSSSDNRNAGWNGIANPSTYHAYINPNANDNKYGLNFGQVYDGDNWTYTPINLDAKALVVGQPVYVQVASTNASVVAFANHDDAGFLHAPRRAKANAVPLIQCEVGIAPSEGETTDRVIVRTLEDKDDAYVIAQDLMKMGVSTIVPQMWVNRYDDRLCINTVAPTGMKADYPLGISVPYDGSYEIDVLENADANASLYLTYNGRAIWNLGYGPYEVYMQHGTNMQYGLRVVYEAPQLVTGMEEATIENGEQIRKVMIDDKVYIIRNGEMYSITGAKVQ